MGRELGAMIYHWVGIRSSDINGQGIRSCDITMGRELGATLYHWVGIRSSYISMSRELGATLYKWVGNQEL